MKAAVRYCRRADNRQVEGPAVLELPSRSRHIEPGAGRSRREHVFLGWFVCLCVVLALAGRLGELFRPFGGDGAIFIYMGKTVSEGGRVGIELIDNKFPTVGLLMSPLWRLLGANWPGYVVAQTGLAIAAVVLLARAAARNIGPHAITPAASFALVYFNCNLIADGFRLETAQSFFVIFAAASALPSLLRDDARDSFVVGLAAGTAAMLKPSGLAVLAAFAIATLWLRHGNLRRLAIHAVAALCGLAIPAAATLIYLVSTDLLPRMPEIWRQIGSYAAHSRWEPWDGARWCVVILLLGFPVLVRGVVFRRPRHRLTMRVDRSILFFVLMWLAIETLGVIAQGRMYPYHFLVLAAPAALLFGMIPRRDQPVALAAALAPMILVSTFGAIWVFQNRRPPLERLAITEYLSRHAAAGDSVWMDDMMRLMVETDLRPGSRYPTTFLWANDDDAPQRFCRAMLCDFEDRRPKYIILPSQPDFPTREFAEDFKELRLTPARRANYFAAWRELNGYVTKNYSPVAQVGGQTVFRRGPPELGYDRPHDAAAPG